MFGKKKPKKPVYELSPEEKQKTERIALWVVGILVMLFLFSLGGDSNKKKSEDNKQQSTKNQVSENVDYTQYQEQVKQFEDKFMAIDRDASNKAQVAQNSLNSGNVYTSYQAFKTAKEAANKARFAYIDMDIDSGLPQDLRDKLSEAKNSANYAYKLKEDAFAAAMQYLDNQKPSDLSTFQSKAEESQQTLFSAAASMASAKVLVGLGATSDNL